MKFCQLTFVSGRHRIPMSSCFILSCAKIFLLWFMLGWIPLGFWRTILSVVVGSMDGGGGYW